MVTIFAFLTIFLYFLVYDPNPLMSLQKRKRRSSQGVPLDGYQTEGGTSSLVAHQTLDSEEDKQVSKEAQRERRRLKKIKKEKLKQQQQQSFDSNPDSERKQKRKHKCGDELCKHRKHKKRRKHKKHHRENNEISAEDEVSSADGIPAEKEDTTSDEQPLVDAADDEEEEEEENEETFNPTIKDETMTEEDVASSVTESSESYYVRV